MSGIDDEHSLDYWLQLAESTGPLAIEASEELEYWIADPFVHDNLSPRQARAALGVIGCLADKGHNVAEVLGLIVAIVELPPRVFGGTEGAASTRRCMDGLLKGECDNEIIDIIQDKL